MISYRYTNCCNNFIDYYIASLRWEEWITLRWYSNQHTVVLESMESFTTYAQNKLPKTPLI